MASSLMNLAPSELGQESDEDDLPPSEGFDPPEAPEASEEALFDSLEPLSEPPPSELPPPPSDEPALPPDSSPLEAPAESPLDAPFSDEAVFLSDEAASLSDEAASLSDEGASLSDEAASLYSSLR